MKSYPTMDDDDFMSVCPKNEKKGICPRDIWRYPKWQRRTAEKKVDNSVFGATQKKKDL